MPVIDIGGLSAVHGLAAQLTALSVIVLAFVLLCRVTAIGGVVVVWTVAWGAALVAIAAMLARYLFLPDLDHQALRSSSAMSNALDFLYQGGKLLYGGLLLAGGLMLRGFRPSTTAMTAAALALLGYAALSAAMTYDPYGLVQWQVPVIVPLLAGTALVLTPRLGPRGERLAGTTPAAIAAAGLALLWLTYYFAFTRNPAAVPLGGQLLRVVQLNSYVDMFGHLALAFALGHVASRSMQDRLVILHRELEEAHDQLRRVARYDELTGVYNRRAFEELARDRGWTESPPLAVAMLDMDNLKDINDERGHAAGDAALAHLAAHLSALLDHIVVFRWGGDEFLCISSHCEAGALAERITETLRELGPVPGLSGMGIEVSVGSVQRGEDESLASAIGRADSAMYMEKFRKRDVVLEQRSLFEEAGIADPD
jgi:diguanylate cyclase (GGDEF)-like protein